MNRHPAGTPTGGRFAPGHHTEAQVTLGCPYAAGPACADCTGACWEPSQPPGPPEPEPCQGCSMVVGGMTWCQDLCATLSSDADVARFAAAYAAAETPALADLFPGCAACGGALAADQMSPPLAAAHDTGHLPTYRALLAVRDRDQVE